MRINMEVFFFKEREFLGRERAFLNVKIGRAFVDILTYTYFQT